ncbi:MAG: DUF11 domain-containing protein [Planctomycetaceae bacterium]|nr:DUF11 domain-containing protein [Planctomycetaceae bacterium]
MKSTLWKLTALAGVMGAGFLVVYQAQQNLTQTGATAQGETGAEEQSGDGPFKTPDGLLEDLASNSEVSLPPSNHESDLPSQSEPSPTLAQSETESNNVDPFADTPPLADSSDTPLEESNGETTETNPFNDLLQSFTRTPEPTQEETAVDSESDVAPASYASIADQSNRGTIETASLDPFADAPAENGQASDENQALPEFDESLSESDPTAEPNLLGLPTQVEPSPLRTVDSAEEEPQLIPPPVDVTEETETADIEETSTQSEEPTLADETMLPEDLLKNAIAQVSGERAAPRDHSLNPFLVFPDNGASTRPQANGSGSPAGQLPSRNEPNPFGNSFTPKSEPQQTILPDGRVEMTIPQREERPAEEFDPFGGPAEQPIRDSQVQPASAQLMPEFEDEPEAEATPSLEAFPATEETAPSLDLQPFNHQPALENTPPVEPATPPVRQNLFEGYGTVSDDSPTGTQQAQITIEKIAPPDAVLNKPLVYSIKVRNVGQAPAENVLVKDMIPKGSRLEGTSPQAVQDENDPNLYWQLGTMKPGDEHTIRIKVIPIEARQIGSVATVTFEAAVAARTNITAPDLKLTVQGPGEVRVGEKAAYRFTLTNVGTADASGVYIRNLIPKGFQHPRGDDLEYEVGMLPKGESKEVNLTLLAVAPGQFDTRAILGAEGDISIEAQKSVSVLTSRLKVHRQGPANRFVGRTAQFTNSIINESSEPVQNITVQETVPDGVEFSRASDNGQYNAQTRTITWQLAGLNPGQQRHLQTEVKPVTPGEKATIIKAFDTRQDMAEVTSQMIVAGFSSLTIDVAHAGQPVPVGEEVALRLTIRNRGTAPAKEVRALVEIPAEMKFVNAKGPVSHRVVGAHTIEFEALNTLDVNGEEQFDIILSAAHQGNDARVRVQLTSAELEGPLNEEESVVIYSDR